MQITHAQKVLWEVYCGYTWSRPEVYCRNTLFGIVEYTRYSNAQWTYFHQQYYRCTKVEKIYSGSFADFIKLITNSNYKNPYKKKKYGRWWRHRYYRLYLPSKYQKKPHHTKKILSEQEISKRDWREKKQFRRDKAKPNWHNGRKTYYKHLSNRMHRQWVREKLKHQDFDFNDTDYKYWQDPWMWD